MGFATVEDASPLRLGHLIADDLPRVISSLVGVTMYLESDGAILEKRGQMEKS